MLRSHHRTMIPMGHRVVVVSSLQVPALKLLLVHQIVMSDVRVVGVMQLHVLIFQSVIVEVPIGLYLVLLRLLRLNH